MPFDRTGDQAEGLRRLLMRTPARVVTVVAATARMGATSTVVNLAAAFRADGNAVLVLDEKLSSSNVANQLGLVPRYDLLNAARGDKPLAEVILQNLQGVRVLPMARAITALPKLTKHELARMQECLTQASRNADVVLVDAAGDVSGISANLAPGEPLVVVLNATAAAITESYALIKRLASESGRKRFEIVVNKAKNEQEAVRVFGNIAQVAHRHLKARMEYLGYIPLDGKLKHATQLRCPVAEAYPAAGVAEAFSGLGARLMGLPAGAGSEEHGLPGIMQRLVRQAGSANLAYAH